MDQLFGWLYEALGSMLYWFSSLFNGQYIFGILLYAILFKILFLPFGIMQQKNQIKMAKLTPKIELIKAKYKGRTDQVTMQKQQQEIMDLQQKEGYNPLSGCLPLLLQLPIITLLYKVIRSPLTYICRLSADQITELAKDVSYVGKNGIIDEIGLAGATNTFIKTNENGMAALAEYDLSRLPNFDLFGMDLGEKPWDSFLNITNEFSLLFLVPVIAAVLTWLSMWLSRKWNANPATQTQDAQSKVSMKMMDLMMPAMTLFMAFGFSGMMGIYWIYQSALGILQSFLIAKLMPLPKYSEEDLKEMKKAQKEAEKNARSAAKSAPKYRSLHYIDDENYDSLPELENDGKNNNSGEMEIPDIKD